MAQKEQTSKQNQNDFPPPSMEVLVEQLEDLVKLALECEKKELVNTASFIEVNKQLIQLREVINILHQSYIQALHSLSLKEADVDKFRKNMEAMKAPEKKLLDKLNRLEGVCEEARAKLYSSLQEN